jgi:hypothetical protein
MPLLPKDVIDLSPAGQSRSRRNSSMRARMVAKIVAIDGGLLPYPS